MAPILAYIYTHIHNSLLITVPQAHPKYETTEEINAKSIHQQTFTEPCCVGTMLDPWKQKWGPFLALQELAGQYVT